MNGNEDTMQLDLETVNSRRFYGQNEQPPLDTTRVQWFTTVLTTWLAREKSSTAPLRTTHAQDLCRSTLKEYRRIQGTTPRQDKQKDETSFQPRARLHNSGLIRISFATLEPATTIFGVTDMINFLLSSVL